MLRIFAFMVNSKGKSNRGGVREGSGRKPLPATDKRTPVTLYVKDSIIASVGKTKLRLKLIAFTEGL